MRITTNNRSNRMNRNWKQWFSTVMYRTPFHGFGVPLTLDARLIRLCVICMRLCALLIPLRALLIRLCHLLIWLFEVLICLCVLLFWLCNLLIWLYALFIRWALFIALLVCACCIHVLFLCTLAIRSFYVLFQCVLLKYSLFALCICALRMHSLHALFICALSMCSLPVIFIRTLFMCSSYAFFNSACTIKVLRKLSLEIYQENVTQDNICRLSTANSQKKGTIDCVKELHVRLWVIHSSKRKW